MYGVPVFKAELCLHKFLSQKIACISLTNAEVEIYLRDDCSQKFTVSLRDGELIMNQICYLRKFGEVSHDESCCYKYDSFIIINGEPANLLLPDNPKMKIF